jgi:ribosomal protein S18 acetylase RimI-like enzyme
MTYVTVAFLLQAMVEHGTERPRRDSTPSIPGDGRRCRCGGVRVPEDTFPGLRLRRTLGPDDVGARVMVRHLLPAGGATDVLGILEAWGGAEGSAGSATHQGSVPHASVRRSDGQVVTVAVSDIIGGHRIPAPPQRAGAADVPDLVLEDIAAVGWRAPEEMRFDGWLLRAAGGFTGRANSVLPLGEPGAPLDEALALVCAWYAERALPACFQVPLPARADLDDALAARGWTAYNATDVLVADIADVLAAGQGAGGRGADADAAVEISGSPSADWLGAYHYRGGTLPADAVGLFTSAPVQGFATVTQNGAVVAVGRVAMGQHGPSRRWAGLTALEVVPASRRRGLGGLVVRALLTWAESRGARHAYLQVAAENTAAQAAYRRAGFTRHHGYHYRLAPPPHAAESP